MKKEFGPALNISTTKKASSTLLLLFGLEVWGSENSEDAKEICLEISSWTSTIILWTKEIGKYSCIFIIFSTALLMSGGSDGAMGPLYFFEVEKSTYISKQKRYSLLVHPTLPDFLTFWRLWPVKQIWDKFKWLSKFKFQNIFVVLLRKIVYSSV